MPTLPVMAVVFLSLIIIGMAVAGAAAAINPRRD